MTAPSIGVPYAMGIQAAAAYAGRPYGRVYEAVKSGELPARRDGKTWIIRRADVQEWIDSFPTYDPNNDN